MSEDAMASLVELVRSGSTDGDNIGRAALEALFGGRYHQRFKSKTGIRDALKLGSEEREGVPYAGLTSEDNPDSGPYGGASVVWFPAKDHGSLMAFVVGTRGLSPDEGILTRPGHRRRASALRRMLARRGVAVWSKPDPASISVPVPDEVSRRFGVHENALRRYSRELYCIAQVPDDHESAVLVVSAFLDLYSHERGWECLAAYKQQREDLVAQLREDLFPRVTSDDVYDRLLARHFVVLQGPPGTGKTRLAEQVRDKHFNGKGMTIQFHPAVTYEDFIVGLSPDTGAQESLRFEVRPGWLLEACAEANDGPFLLVIDEVNRADLGKILGEAIYLFEPGEVGKRSVRLAHAVEGKAGMALPENLYVLATMNTADRSIASIDLAIRRRFTFMTMMPEREVVAKQGLDLASEFFDRISDVFVEHAPEDALILMPGHSYYLANSGDELRKRLRFELVPLLSEYLREGYLGPASAELYAVRDALEDAVR